VTADLRAVFVAETDREDVLPLGFLQGFGYSAGLRTPDTVGFSEEFQDESDSDSS